jgi:hypothetical protein
MTRILQAARYITPGELAFVGILVLAGAMFL